MPKLAWYADFRSRITRSLCLYAHSNLPEIRLKLQALRVSSYGHGQWDSQSSETNFTMPDERQPHDLQTWWNIATPYKIAYVEDLHSWKVKDQRHHRSQTRNAASVINGWSYNVQTYSQPRKYVLSNSESVQCNFFIFDHVMFIQFKICCSVQKIMKIGWFFYWDMAIYRFSKWRPSAILELFYHHTRPSTKSLLLHGRSCLSNFMWMWYTDMKI